MKILTEIIGVACFASIFAVMAGFWQWLEWYLKIKIPKPFNCELCMGWWLGLLYFWFANYNIPEIIIFAAATAVLSFFIIKYAER